MYGTIEDIRVRCIPCSSALCLPLVVIDVGAKCLLRGLNEGRLGALTFECARGSSVTSQTLMGGTKFFKSKLVQAGSTIETAISALYIR